MRVPITMALPSAPGLGIELDENAVARDRVDVGAST
jgi:L-alanine-DL-glutamate epimerase-like enolase superfamily enzyme